ncbi:nitroreductase family protein [Deinococcus pimensis]|uniref:nitroreductase family protein n=1 Tax=Deinococcus pimensis TaxID=309888 RepID=UPI000487A47B
MTQTLPETTTTLDVKTAMETRRSIRRFVQEPMDQADLREILRLTSLAPSANNVQTWRFAVVQNKDLQARLQEASYNQQQVTNAPAVIVLYSDMEDVLANVREIFHPGMGEEQINQRAANFAKGFESQSVQERAAWANAQANIALGYLLLAARGLGYDTVPMLGFEPAKVREILGLPAHAEIAAIVPVGKRAEEGFEHHRHNLDRIAKFY